MSSTRLLLSAFARRVANKPVFERFHRRVAQLVERCLDTAEVWGSSPHAPTKTLDNFWAPGRLLSRQPRYWSGFESCDWTQVSLIDQTRSVQRVIMSDATALAH